MTTLACASCTSCCDVVPEPDAKHLSPDLVARALQNFRMVPPLRVGAEIHVNAEITLSRLDQERVHVPGPWTVISHFTLSLRISPTTPIATNTTCTRVCQQTRCVSATYRQVFFSQRSDAVLLSEHVGVAQDTVDPPALEHRIDEGETVD